MLSLCDLGPLRKNIRQKRRTLDRYTQKKAAQKILYRLMHHPKITTAQHIGLYLDAFGEIATQRLMFALLKQHKTIYLPVICTMNQTLVWQKTSIQQLRNRRFALHPLGMRQAMPSRAKNIAQLDTLIMPLVIFDAQGHRVGMGGGFYDRTLYQHPQRPYRLGLAHDLQYSAAVLPQQQWDQNLNSVCTPSRTWYFKS